MNKKLYTSLVLLMSFSLIGIILMQGYWIYSAWQTKEEEFSLAVNRTLREVVDEIQSRELNDYVYTYQLLIDSLGTPDESNFTDVFLFLDEDQSSNLSTFFAYGILEEDYNINQYDSLGFINTPEINISFENVQADFDSVFCNPNSKKSDIVTIVKKYIPSFMHVETGKHLDQKM